MPRAIETAGYCWYCRRRTRHVRRAPPGLVPNFALSVLTFGLWVPAWAARAAWHGWKHPWRCQECGTPLGKAHDMSL